MLAGVSWYLHIQDLQRYPSVFERLSTFSEACQSWLIVGQHGPIMLTTDLAPLSTRLPNFAPSLDRGSNQGATEKVKAKGTFRARRKIPYFVARNP